jgi:hypothetical protein
MDNSVEFPISIRFENGEVEQYKSPEELEMNLEDFDSDEDADCEVRDRLGRRVRLRVSLLKIKELSVLD